MKKITILLFTLLVSIFATEAQTISLIGDAVGGWNATDDVDLTTTDDNIYTLSGVTLASGGFKFRQDHDWGSNWGTGDAFPSGTAELNGGNFTAVAGTYDVTFNLTTLEFNFESNATYPEIGIIGSAINGGSTDDTDMFTTDGINYFLNAFNVTDGDAHFRQNNVETINWSNSDFPSGTGTQDGTAIAVTANDYNITFNINTGDYSFDFLDISLIGAFNDWAGDLDLTTTDGENYTLEGFVLSEDGGLKFRQNHDWGTSWGDGGGNIALTADTYNVTFVRSTGEYTFTSTTASVNNIKYNKAINLYPTLTNEYFKSNSRIKSISIYNISGKLVKSFSGDYEIGYSFDVSELSSAIYFIKINAIEGNSSSKIIIK